MNVLFLDDDSVRVDMFVRRTGINPHHVTNHKDFTKAILDGNYDVVMLDHDLGDEELCGNGVICSRILCDNWSEKLEKSIFIIHSSNPVGAMNMRSLIATKTTNVFVIPFAYNKVRLIHDSLEFI